MSELLKKTSRELAFTQFIIECLKNNGSAAALRRADNSKTEYQSWDILVGFNIDLDKPWERLPFATIAAAMSKAKIEHNGSLKIGQAIARCYDDGKESDQAKAKLRRLLACDSVEEACRVLRPLFSLINNKVTAPLDFAQLLNDLRWFNNNHQKIKSQWAQDFYCYQGKGEQT